MKKFLVFFSAVMVLASCSVNRAAVSTTSVQAPVVSTTIVSLEVAKKPITYTYHPNRQERRLSVSQLVSNATYEALQKQTNADELVKVSYYLNGKAGLFGFVKVKSVTITGYPATYKNFREPDANDRENIDAVYNAVTTVKVK